MLSLQHWRPAGLPGPQELQSHSGLTYFSLFPLPWRQAEHQQGLIAVIIWAAQNLVGLTTPECF